MIVTVQGFNQSPGVIADQCAKYGLEHFHLNVEDASLSKLRAMMVNKESFKAFGERLEELI